MNDLQKLRNHLKPGKVYRRSELAKFSKSVDRHLRQLVETGVLRKLWTGVYHYPRTCCIREVPPDIRDVVRAFLRTDDFFMTNLSFYNELRCGTTQLYNERFVYNSKRNGRIKLNRFNYYFLKGRKFPKKTTEEFMLIDMLNNLDMLAEDRKKVKKSIGRRALEMGKDKILPVASAYGKVSTKKYFEKVFKDEACSDAGLGS